MTSIRRHRGLGVAVACVVTLARAAASSSAAPPADPCSGEITQSEYLKAAEQNLATGYSIPFAKVNLPGLRDAVDEHWRARLAGDVSKLLELEIALSPSHLDVEVSGWKRILADDRRLHLSRPTPHSIWFDETNDKHVYTYTTVLIRKGGRCIEDGVAIEWVLLHGEWFTFPQESDGGLIPLRKGRPNEGYVAK